jgi:hypothetical protein
MRKNLYIDLKPTIDDFVSKARSNEVGILDFYLIFKMPFERFKTLCNGLISSTEMMQFNILFSPYIKGFYDVNLSEKIIQNTKEMKVNMNVVKYDQKKDVSDEGLKIKSVSKGWKDRENRSVLKLHCRLS